MNVLINSIILGIYFAKFDGLENTFLEKVITGQFECYGTIELRQAWLLPIKILKLSSNIVKT